MARSTTTHDADAAWHPAILIVDDHPLYRSGLKEALGALAAEFGEAATFTDAMDALAGRRFDLILFDWHLPDGGGCRGLLAICQLVPKVPVVVISADEDEAIRMAAASIGAAACLSKSADATQLRETLGRLLSRAGVPAPHPDAAAPQLPAAVKPLTVRQREVLEWMARGDPNKQIADRLGIAEATVRAHVSDILQLMRVRNRTEAVIQAQHRSLIGPGRR